MGFDKFSHMHLGNVEMIDKLYGDFQKNPQSVDESWRYFFEGWELGQTREKGEATDLDLRVFSLIEAYRQFGHLKANVNPIALVSPSQPEELELATHGLKPEDLGKECVSMGLLQTTHAPLQKIIDRLESIYCQKIGVEYKDRCDVKISRFIQEQIEMSSFRSALTVDQKKNILEWLNKAELFETFIHTKYVGQKRFSLEGGETLIPILHEIIEEGAEKGVDEILLGMAHRGRLNVLANILQKSFSMIFGEFEDFFDPQLVEASGDVKYHKGFSADIESISKKKVHISLTANASHLEAVDAVVLGKVKGKQERRKDQPEKKVMGILIHGDSSFAGQGIVYETMQFSKLEGYGVGGVIHIVVNNQIGFTTLPHEYRSSRYSSSIASIIGAPVFHINAEDPEGCICIAKLAMTIRQMFGIDVVIELHCYRKYGHNEGDEPGFTQPLEYQLIGKKKSIRELFRDQLIDEGTVEKEMAKAVEEEFKKSLHYELEEMKLKSQKIPEQVFQGIWSKYKEPTKHEFFTKVSTQVSIDTLRELGKLIYRIPDGLEINSKLKKLILQRYAEINDEASKFSIDWAMAEHLAFASLLWENVPIRLSGQDSARGTFTHRHAVWVDQKNDHHYYPFSHLKKGQPHCSIYNSSLSEFGVLGFEFGYSLVYPESLVIWEAQFGDFVNGAQVIIDQFICSSEQKWKRFSGLVMLLPHGYEGQGSEHSSARLERFLQQAAGNNWQVVYPTTPAQYFHLLRRQMLWSIRVPLIVMSPKGLLRHPACVSSLQDLSSNTFSEILDDPEYLEATRILLCAGRVYYDLLEERKKKERTDVAIIRIEQLYPLHIDSLVEIFHKYDKVQEIYWVQEEPINMGSYSFIAPQLQKILPVGKELVYVGRKAASSPATGSHKRHAKEQREIVETAFHLR